MLRAVVPSNPSITSKVVIAPVASRRKPGVPLASLNHPVIAPAVFMLRAVVLIAPGGSKVVKDWPNAATGKVANAIAKMARVKHRKSLRREGLSSAERKGVATTVFNMVMLHSKLALF